MKITLVTPPSGFLLDERVFPSLGILKVGASLHAAGHQVVHMDLSGIEDFEGVLLEYCSRNEQFSPIFALTATTPQMPAAVKINEQLKSLLPNCKTVIGGPHVTLLNAALHKKSERARKSFDDLATQFDCIILGDGEKAIHEAIKLLQAETQSLVIDADDPKSDLWMSSDDITHGFWPDRHLIDVNSYNYEIDGERAMHIIAQLGCPFECGFCGGRFSPMLRRIRQRSTESIIKEMEYLHLNYGVKALMLNDDELNVNRNMIELMKAIATLGKRHMFTWKLRGFVKAELFNQDQAEAMYEAGFRWLLCGFESGHPRILKNINKKATLEDNSAMLRIAHKVGLKVKALMSFGHPGESEETILATRKWLLEEKPDDFDCTIITKYPGTPYYDLAVPHNGDNSYCYSFNGDNLYSHDVDFTKDAAYYKGVPGNYKSFVWTDYLSSNNLVKIRDYVESDVREKLRIPYPIINTVKKDLSKSIFRKI